MCNELESGVVFILAANTYFSNLDSIGKVNNLSSVYKEVKAMMDPNNDPIANTETNNPVDKFGDKKISNDTMEKLKKAFNKDKVSVKPNGILDNLTLHYQNEAARHKLLDVLGDLALIGKRI